MADSLLQGLLSGYGDRAVAATLPFAMINQGVANMQSPDWWNEAGGNFADNLAPPVDKEQLASWGMNFVPGSGIIGQVGPLFHGSPYKFSKFANESIGTGEGAQAFGYGHYLTDSPEIAKSYAEQSVKQRGVSLYTGYSDTHINKIFDAAKKDSRYERVDIVPAAGGNKEVIAWPKYNPHKYTATVNKNKPASEDVFLEWSSPINDTTKSKISSFIESRYSPDNPIRKEINKVLSNTGVSGDQIYKRIEGVLGGGIREAPKQTSDLIAQMGFTGIKYPAGTLSGVKDSKAYNYVIFDPKNISIDAANGKPMFEAGTTKDLIDRATNQNRNVLNEFSDLTKRTEVGDKLSEITQSLKRLF
jgi:hypothetical protein